MWRKGIALLLLFVLIVPGYRSHLFSLDFVDEEDNIVIGSYLEQGNKLYRDIYSQHQPAQFVLANVLQTVTSPDNIFMTVKRHREFMILWSMIWITLLTLRFGYSLYFVALIFELTKMILLGNMFLAETFVVYPLMYLLSYLFSKAKSPGTLEQIFVLGLIWFLALSLTPLWPLLLVVTVQLYLSSQSKPSFILRFAALGILCFALLFPKVDFLDYYHDVFWINTQFYIPLTTGISPVSALIHALFSPLITLFTQGDSLLLPLLKLLSLIYLYNLFVLVRGKEYKIALALHTILFLINLRYINPANTLYGAFHLLPWYGALLYGAVAFLRAPRLPRFFLLTLLIIFALPIARQHLWDQRDINTDYFVHYSQSADLSQVVQILSRDVPRSIWVEPVNYWVHYQNNSRLYTTMINYYPWMHQTPSFQTELAIALKTSWPDLVYLNNQNLSLGAQLNAYTPLMRDGGKTMLYLRNDLIPSLTNSQLQELAFYRFTF